ncbi:TAXI family TRAP transporter solute-binding subunit [Virgifigura deserti]|uniref:TAXI family TRAP transporter solute-binding subunit n=1 Tax=Virgifigura deserti TaxID=2268457 RepID=UPI003CCC00F1
MMDELGWRSYRRLFDQRRISRRDRRACLGTVLGTLAGCLTLTALPALAQEIRFFRIGTGATGGSYFPVGGMIANAISNPPGSRSCDRGGSCGIPGLIAVAQTTQGSVENVRAIGSGQFDSALCQADVAHWAFTGSSIFAETGAIDSLRAIAHLYQESLHVVVRADSDIHAIEDLTGKRVSISEKGSGTLLTADMVLDSFGIARKALKAEYLSIGAAASRLAAGEIDAFFMVGGHPLPAIVDLARRQDIRLLPVDGEGAEALRMKYPFLTVDLIPATAYRGTDTTITIGIGTLWLVSATLSEDVVFGLARALWHPSTRKLLDEGNPIGRRIRIETALLGIPIPLHPGAARYYAEADQLRGLRPLPK